MMKRLRRLASSQRAFTLSEMLIVLAIMGVLSGIAIWSFAAVRDSAEPIADGISETGVQLRCDAARGGLLFVAGCEGQTLPAALAEPQLGPSATTLVISPVAGSTGTGGAATFTFTLTDQADEPFVDATIRYEVAGIGAIQGTTDLPTAGDGTTTWSYSRSVTGVDTVTACTNADGSAPEDCATATGPSEATTHTWVLPPPTLVSWDRVGNSRAEVVWNRALGGSPNVVGYQFYNSAADCTNDTNPGSGSNRAVVSVAGDGTTTIEVDSGGVGLNPGQVGNRRLRVLADTETNTEGLGNVETGCLAVGSVPEPATLVISPSQGTSEVNDTTEFTVTVLDGNGDGYAGVSVRYEVEGISALSGATSSATNNDGEATFSYVRSEEGDDTITACTNADGSLPTSCDDATGPTGTAERTWADDAPPPLPPPTVVSWNRVNNSTADIVWDRELGNTPDMAGYRIYNSAANCTSNTSPATVNTRVVQSVAGNGVTTIRITISGVGLQPGQIGNRRLQVVANTETNIEGLGNQATGCLSAS